MFPPKRNKFAFLISLALGLVPLSGFAEQPDTHANKDMTRVEILSHWSVKLPFTVQLGTAKQVAFAPLDSELASGDRILAINGMGIPHINAIPAMLRLSMAPGDMTYLKVDLDIKPADGGPQKQMQMALPITQDTVLANGMRFETIHNGHRWDTTLVQMPNGTDTDLMVGDKIIGYGDGTAFNMRYSLRDQMRQERRAGKSRFSVIVARGTKLMLCNFSY